MRRRSRARRVTLRFTYDQLTGMLDGDRHLSASRVLRAETATCARQSPPMPALPASAHLASSIGGESIEVIVPPRSGGGLRSTMETAGVEPAPSSVQARRSARRASSPGCRCGRVESNHHSARRRGYSPLSSPVLSVRESVRGGRPGSNRRLGDHDPGCFRLHHGHHERGRPGSNRRPLA